MTTHSPRLIIIHPKTRSYRVSIFDALAKRYDCTFLFMKGEKRSAQYPESKSWKYKDFQPYHLIGYSSGFLPGIVKELLLRHKDYDIIISSGLTSFSTHISFLIAKLLRKKIIVWVEDWVWPKNVRSRLAFPYIRTIVRQADVCIAAGTKTRDFFISLGAQPPRVFIAPNCAIDLNTILIDLKKLEVLRQKINPHRKIVVSYLGRIVRYKALDTLIEAFAKLEQERNDVMLLIVGDGPFAFKCKTLIERLKIKNFLWPQYDTLLGTKELEPIPQSEFLYYYYLTDIFVLPGRFIWNDNVPCEAWGFTINEAMSLGKPVISTNSVAAAYDLIKDRVTGFQVKENNVEALYNALSEILERNLEIFGLEARKIINKKFTYHKMLAGFEKAISSVSRSHS